MKSPTKFAGKIFLSPLPPFLLQFLLHSTVKYLGTYFNKVDPRKFQHQVTNVSPGKKFGDSSLYSSVVPPDISSFGTPQAPHTPEDHTLARKAGDENFKFGQDMAFKK